MLIFVVAEVMFFAGLISAFTIIRVGRAGLAAARPAAPADRGDRAQHRRAAARRASRSAVAHRALPARPPQRARGRSLAAIAARRLLRAVPGRRVGRPDPPGPDAHLELARQLLLPDRRHCTRCTRWSRSALLAYTWLRLQRGWLAQQPARRPRRCSGTSWWALADPLRRGVPVTRPRRGMRCDSPARRRSCSPRRSCSRIRPPPATVCTGGQTDEVRYAFLWTTGFCPRSPLGLIGGFAWFVRRRARELAAKHARPAEPALSRSAASR